MLNIPKATEKSFADGKILRSINDGVGVITFNNPAKRNAMSLDMWEGLGHALVELRDDAGVRVVILVGAGDKAFVSGADISQFEKNRHNAEASEEYAKRSAAQRALLADYPKPTIACIRGFCLGGGMQVAMLADIRIASDNSQFGIPAAKLGIAYGYDGLKNLVSLVGPSWARLLMYTGMRIDATEAERIGLVDRVMPDAELWEATMEIARTISGNAPLAIKAGLLPEVVAELKAQKRPSNMKADEALVYDFVTELTTTHQVSDATFARVRQILSEQQIVDLTTISGAYVTVAMLLAMAEESVPAGKELPFKVGEP